MTNELIEQIKQKRKQRLEICNSCDFFNKQTSECSRCGCIMSIKTNLPEASCPIGKW